ncbi:DUF4293 family protein [Emticicia sp. CRIBPO]|uniref:DUF4293 domain-containing protein n=1 Tax=Emticicia sp. CRIBPO TaxID=2683258 RepID=UPI0014122E6B|nr:DUF4293 domain-containing protein [Emticicia sp. CRIBPO]NBA87301.1 DUF4293 family protein [Emticicia sp. CRIBPO]
MLQRIQSLLLLVAAISMGVFLGTNSFTKQISPDEAVIVNPYHVLHTKGSLAAMDKPIYYVALLGVLALGLSLFSIFQYRNRVRQMLFVALNSLFMGLSLGLSVYHIQNDAVKIGADSIQGVYGIGIYAAFLALACNWVANRFIRKDEKMVKDADRMR